MSKPPDRLAEALSDRYTIERELGQGGMATVYLADDLRHHRKVALKVLRPDLAATLGPQRFLREVTIAANLTHPHILPLYDSGEAAGFLYYVMPFVEGESLRDRLAKHGELPVTDAARILRDVADAMAAAHAKGVVHRDIKPENIMLAGRHALVADFGVAKAVSEATGRQLLTSEGVALGTPIYMAPEQATANPLTDHRADLYAFGVTAYEMLTGQPPFIGPTPQAVLAAHVTEEPVPVTQRRTAIPAVLATLIMRCLEKKPADRPQSAEELLPVLEGLGTPSGGSTPAETQPVRAVPSRRMATLIVGLVGLTAAGILGSRLLRSKPLHITISAITPVTSEPGVELQPAISPTGKEVAYVAGPIAAPHLAIRSTAGLAGGGTVRLADTSSGSEWYPRWSPDGDFVRFLGCRAQECTWSEMGKLGGAARPVRLSPQARGQRLAWSTDGSRVAFVVGDTIFAGTVGDTTVRPIAVHTVDYWGLHSLAWSPGDERIAYVNGNSAWRSSGNVAASSIWVVDARGGAPVAIVDDPFLNASPAWLDADHLLFVSNRDGPRGVYVVEVGAHGRRGEPTIVPGVADPHAISYAIGAHRLAYAKLTLRQNMWSFPMHGPAPVSIRDGRAVTTGTQVVETGDISPDGRWLVYDSNRHGNMDLFKVSVDGGEPVPLVDDPLNQFAPRWSPDGREIAFYGSTEGAGRTADEVFLMPSDGGTWTVLTDSPRFDNNPHWSPDGLHIAFHSLRTGRSEVWLLTRDGVGRAWHDATQVTDFGCWPVGWTRDGRSIGCWRRGTSELVFVEPEGAVVNRRDFAATDELDIDGVTFARDGTTILVVASHTDGRSGVWAVPLAGGVARLLVAADDPSVLLFGTVSAGPDRLYVTVSEYESDIWVMSLEY